jgi:hypothetical protein
MFFHLKKIKRASILKNKKLNQEYIKMFEKLEGKKNNIYIRG